ncbi:MAG: DUF4148 domain-containing protein [Burkholderiaceae bacterium]|jgi:hypothetical protein|uniref:DUF4148 domain-containing protein n=1 Tax=unclassified Polaromonas TaxID=2638319 RepID=UPI000BCE7905|nr:MULTISPECIES: DUF4148 domain-containing protein [unclassified Polaromonas]MDO8772904.1 DUF4148 domain-containing protein [Burkholderiaceae bacterium]MDO9259972.1 DUF4148 domain-containing protein [Polaromonas sp.]OYZ17765.1 MAG: DUF4148 domain-containing protein [Polaromonas sp. 16-63-31]HQS39074.1 DUF4148 domain-containing protein [Polaromonas sp.]
MLFRKTVFALALAGAAIPAAFANSGGTWVGGEQGFETHTVQSTTSRADVQKELQAFRKNPKTAEGGRLVGGEAGYIPPQHSYAFQDGRLVHTDSIAHNTPKPSLAMTDAERTLFQEQYAN